MNKHVWKPGRKVFVHKPMNDTISDALSNKVLTVTKALSTLLRVKDEHDINYRLWHYEVLPVPEIGDHVKYKIWGKEFVGLVNGIIINNSSVCVSIHGLTAAYDLLNIEIVKTAKQLLQEKPEETASQPQEKLQQESAKQQLENSYIVDRIKSGKVNVDHGEYIYDGFVRKHVPREILKAREDIVAATNKYWDDVFVYQKQRQTRCKICGLEACMHERNAGRK